MEFSLVISRETQISLKLKQSLFLGTHLPPTLPPKEKKAESEFVFVTFQIEHGKCLGKDGLSIKFLREKGYESIFIGIGKLL